MTSGLPVSIPSPTTGVWHLGPFPVRAYALCILLGIVVAVWMTGRRLADRGHPREKAVDISAWAVPFGIVGGRLYHVITTPDPYFGKGGHPVRALYIWEGGLGIWGAIALGAVGAWIGARRYGIPFSDYVDAAAPGVAVAQALGRWGNWFNNELYGRRTDVPWGLTIHEWDQSAGHAVRDASGKAVVLGTFHPTFLYESLWCLLLAVVLFLVDRRVVLRRGQLFGLYVAGYPVGRVVVELMRSDPAHTIFGVRVNVWTSIVVFLLGVALVILARRRAPRVRAGAGSQMSE
ncbi:prolipoprotein diacylglyceryl transferase [Pedococcus sp. 5OH_020]|uniref:prolipoprotein diacylglyceryl transferase n=1 Tax=Pedococcus sp. 5OH_020 TaxID=2989814 RepID=UPI0022EA0334|nr:prolipoprotein diacylglyceryl transferase [Pedococcus sp. 5OH_020]